MFVEIGKMLVEVVVGFGCLVVQIVKLILFCWQVDGVFVLVIVSGVNCVDERKVVEQVGLVGCVDVKFVCDNIGYVIGGVCLIGYLVEFVMLIDVDLFVFDSLWVVVGYLYVVFNLLLYEFVLFIGVLVVDVVLWEFV